VTIKQSDLLEVELSSDVVVNLTEQLELSEGAASVKGLYASVLKVFDYEASELKALLLVLRSDAVVLLELSEQQLGVS
jgi:hypothetical protein